MGAGRKTQTYTYDTLNDSAGSGFADVQRNLGDGLAGVIFGCTSRTQQECLDNKLFGLPAQHWCYVQVIPKWMPLFLFNYHSRELLGIFRAESAGDWELDPHAWQQNQARKTQYPAQVRVELEDSCPPIHEREFKHVLHDNYYEGKKFAFELTIEQVRALCTLFRAAADRVHAASARASIATVAAPPAAKQLGSTGRSGSMPAAAAKHPPRPEAAAPVSPAPAPAPTASVSSGGSRRAPSEASNPSAAVASEWPPAATCAGGTTAAANGTSYTTVALDAAAAAADAQVVSELQPVHMHHQQPDGSYQPALHFDPLAVQQQLQPGVAPSAATALVMAMHSLWTQVALLKHENQALRYDLHIMGQQVQAQQKQQQQQPQQPFPALTPAAHVGMPSYRPPKTSGAVAAAAAQQAAAAAATMAEAAPTAREGTGAAAAAARQAADAVQDLYLLGGNSPGGGWTAAYGSWCPLQGKWKDRGEMPTVRGYGGAAPVGRTLFVLGGGTGQSWLNTMHAYHVDKDEWGEVAPMQYVRGSLGVASLGGVLYAVGGGVAARSRTSDGPQGTYYAEVEMYDPATNAWTAAPPLRTRRFAVSAVEMGGALYATGGFDGKAYLRSAERLDPREGRWQSVADMPRKRGSHSTAVLGGQLFAVGGWEAKSPLSHVDWYDPRADAWQDAAPMAAPRSYLCAAAVDGTLYALGGMQAASGAFNKTVERYVPAPDASWEVVGMPAGFAVERSFMASSVISRMM